MPQMGWEEVNLSEGVLPFSGVTWNLMAIQKFIGNGWCRMRLAARIA